MAACCKSSTSAAAALAPLLPPHLSLHAWLHRPQIDSVLTSSRINDVVYESLGGMYGLVANKQLDDSGLCQRLMDLLEVRGGVDHGFLYPRF